MILAANPLTSPSLPFLHAADTIKYTHFIVCHPRKSEATLNPEATSQNCRFTPLNCRFTLYILVPPLKRLTLGPSHPDATFPNLKRLPQVSLHPPQSRFTLPVVASHSKTTISPLQTPLSPSQTSNSPSRLPLHLVCCFQVHCFQFASLFAVYWFSLLFVISVPYILLNLCLLSQ